MLIISQNRNKFKKFSICFLTSLVVFCIPFIGSAFNFIKSSHSQNFPEEVYHPNESDSLTLITAVREEISGTPEFFILLRINPMNNKISIAAIPCEIMVEDAGKFDSASNVWKREGAKRASAAVGNALSLSVDRWLDLDKSGLVKLIDTIGTVDYLLEEPLIIDKMQILNSGRQILDGKKFSLFSSQVSLTKTGFL